MTFCYISKLWKKRGFLLNTFPENSRLRFKILATLSAEIPPCLRHISGISPAYIHTYISQAYLRFIWGISHVYFRHISGTYQAYLREIFCIYHISDISKAFLIHIPSKSQAHFRTIPGRYFFNISGIRCISDIFHAYFRHMSSLSVVENSIFLIHP